MAVNQPSAVRLPLIGDPSSPGFAPAFDKPQAFGQAKVRLITAGETLFAERSIESVSLREIAIAAGNGNNNAVQYHFGGKDGLYTEVLTEGQRRLHALEIPAPGTTAEQRLAGFVRTFMERVLTEAPESAHAQLMFREMIEPTAALDRVVAEFIRPSAEELESILRQLLGPGFTRRQRQHIGLSIVSQILNYKHCRAVIERLFPELPLGPSHAGALAEHVTAFSLAAVQGLRAGRRIPGKS